MVPEELFSLALGLVPPWLVDHVTFTVEEKRLDLHINFPKGSRFLAPSVVRSVRYMIPVTILGGTWISSSMKPISMPAYLV